MTIDNLIVTDVPERNRFEAHLDGKLAGFSAYQKAGELIVFTHTEVDRAFEGRGIGAELVRRALDEVRAAGTHKVLPLCPFVRAFTDQHEQYWDLIFAPPPSTAVD
jgi:predicted GNAT family acetyltransferase